MIQSALLVIWGETNKGIQRSHNEDQIYPDSHHKNSMRTPTPQALTARGTLLIVADGIGGAQVGDTAANFAVRTAVDHYYGDPRPLPLDRLLQAAVEMANTSVYNYVSNSPAFQQTGCTMTAAVIQGMDLVVAHVGDSRAYLLRKGVLYPLTSDHNVAQLLATGQTPPGGQALAGNALTRSLGAGPTVVVDVNRFPLEAGDTVLVCSDGLHSVVGDDSIKQVLGRAAPEKAAHKLIDMANAQGGPDNISVVIARLPDGTPQAAALGAKSGSNRTPLYVVAGMMALAVLVLLALTLNGPRGKGGAPPPPPATTPEITSATSTVPMVASLATVGLTSEPTNSPTLTGNVAPAPAEATQEPGGGPSTTTEPGRKATSTIQPTSTPKPPTATPTRRIVRPTLPSASPTLTKPADLSIPTPELLSPEDGDTKEVRVDLTWKSRDLNPNEQFEVKVQRQRDDLERFFPLTNSILSIVFDEYQDFFKEPGDFLWSVRIVDNSRNEKGPFSQQRRFKFVREVDDSPQNTPTPSIGKTTPTIEKQVPRKTRNVPFTN